jgi:hypothetical protein
VRTFNEVRLLIPVFLQRSLLLVLCNALDRQGSTSNLYNPEDAWTDAGGRSVQIKKKSGRWSCAEIFLNRSLGHDTGNSCELNA